MDQIAAAANGAWQVLIACLILGAGLPALFTVGLRELAAADGQLVDGTEVSGSSSLHRFVAYLLFGIVVGAILLGLSFIVAHGFGYSITFDGIMPVISKK